MSNDRSQFYRVVRALDSHDQPKRSQVLAGSIDQWRPEDDSML